MNFSRARTPTPLLKTNNLISFETHSEKSVQYQQQIIVKVKFLFISICLNVKLCIVRVEKVRKPQDSPYEGPFRIKKRSVKFLVLTIGDGKTDTVFIDRMKSAYKFYFQDNHPTKGILEKKKQLSAILNGKC